MISSKLTSYKNYYTQEIMSTIVYSTVCIYNKHDIVKFSHGKVFNLYLNSSLEVPIFYFCFPISQKSKLNEILNTWCWTVQSSTRWFEFFKISYLISKFSKLINFFKFIVYHVKMNRSKKRYFEIKLHLLTIQEFLGFFVKKFIWLI